MTVERSRQPTASAGGTQRSRSRRRLLACAVSALAGLGLLVVGAGTGSAQTFNFPPVPKPEVRQRQTDGQMLVQAQEIHYDYANERVSAVGNVQIYYNGSTLEADRFTVR